MKTLLPFICCLFPILTFLLIIVPIYIAKYINIPPEHKAYRRRVKEIEREYRRSMDEYNSLQAKNKVNSLAGLRRMKPVNFEKHIAYIFQEMGYNAYTTARTGDDGIDVIATRNGQTVVAQCKRYAASNKVGSPEIRNFIGAMALKHANHGYFVTTSTFTEPAKQTATQKQNLTLVDGAKIIEWWQKYKIGPYKELTPPQKQPYPPEPPSLPPAKILGFSISQWIILVMLGQITFLIFGFLFSITS